MSSLISVDYYLKMICFLTIASANKTKMTNHSGMKLLLGTMTNTIVCLLLSSNPKTCASSDWIRGIKATDIDLFDRGHDYHFPIHDSMNEPPEFNDGNNAVSLTYKTSKSKANCVSTDRRLRRAKSKAPTISLITTDISLCKKLIKINGTKINPITNRTGILL